MISSIPSSGSAVLSRTSGIYSGIDRATKAAADIAQTSTQESHQLPQRLGAALVKLKQGEHQVAASAAVIKTAGNVLGTLLDIRV